MQASRPLNHNAQNHRESPSISKPAHIRSLTGIRALAALWVVFGHFNKEIYSLFPALTPFGWLTTNAGLGVDIFFILSGFILAYTYQHTIKGFNFATLKIFIWYRFCRIYPPYFVALLAMIAAVALAELKGTPHNPAAYPLSQLPWETLLLQNWGVGTGICWNYPDWSVSAEWFAYLFIFPLVFIPSIRLRNPWTGITLILLLLATYVCLNNDFNSKSPLRLLQVTCEFASGVLLFRVKNNMVPLSFRSQQILAFTTVVSLLSLLYFAFHPYLHGFLVLVVLAAGIFVLSFVENFLSRFFALGLMVYLGEISYSLYLTHGISQRLLKIALPAAKYADSSFGIRSGVFLICATAVIGFAILLYHTVEVPGRSFLREFFRAKNHTSATREQTEIKA